MLVDEQKTMQRGHGQDFLSSALNRTYAGISGIAKTSQIHSIAASHKYVGRYWPGGGGDEMDNGGDGSRDKGS